MSNRVELFLKLALAAKQAADMVPGESKQVPLTNPDLPGSTPADLKPLPVNEAANIANPPGLIQQGVNKAQELGGQAMSAVQNFQAPQWLQGGMDWAKQHPTISAGAGGLGVGALLAYTMLRKKNRKHAAASFIRPHINPNTVTTRIMGVNAGKGPGNVKLIDPPMVRKDLAAGGPQATAAAIRDAAHGPALTAQPKLPAAGAGLEPKAPDAKALGPVGGADPQTTVTNAIAQGQPMVEKGVRPSPSHQGTQDVGVKPKAPMGAKGTAAVAGVSAAGGAAAGAAGQHAADARTALAANPDGNTVPTTGTGNALAGAGDWIQKYLGGFAQSPTQWDGSHIAGGVGAGALLAYLLSQGGDD